MYGIYFYFLLVEEAYNCYNSSKNLKCFSPRKGDTNSPNWFQYLLFNKYSKILAIFESDQWTWKTSKEFNVYKNTNI